MAVTMTGAGEGSGQRQQPATRPRRVLVSGDGVIVALTVVTPQQQSWRTPKAAVMEAADDCSLRSCDHGAGDRYFCRIINKNTSPTLDVLL